MSTTNRRRMMEQMGGHPGGGPGGMRPGGGRGGTGPGGGRVGMGPGGPGGRGGMQPPEEQEVWVKTVLSLAPVE